MAKPPTELGGFRRRGALIEVFSDCEGGVTSVESCCSRGRGVLNKENDDWNASDSELMLARFFFLEKGCLIGKRNSLFICNQRILVRRVCHRADRGGGGVPLHTGFGRG